MDRLGHNQFWAKTTKRDQPGISVRDHCLNAGCVSEVLISMLPSHVLDLLPQGAATLAALHDIGKITLGFQTKCSHWVLPDELDDRICRSASVSVSDHARVSHVFLQDLLKPAKAHLWAAAVGAHHGRPKGRKCSLPYEAAADWANEHRQTVTKELIHIFGPLPGQAPDVRFDRAHSDLWLLAGLITVADWISSNEEFYSSEEGVSLEASRELAKKAFRPQ